MRTAPPVKTEVNAITNEDMTVEATSVFETLFFGGTIYAEEDGREKVEALGIRDGKVQAAGPLRELEGRCDDRTVRRDLRGRALLPAFLDPHNHFCVRSLTPLMADCRTPPLQTSREVLGRMRDHANAVEAGGWVVGWGHDEELLQDARCPTRWDLDAACPRNPAILLHVTLHRCVVNSLALAYCGIDRYARDPSGGRIGRDVRGEPSGVLEERAAMPPFDVARRDLLTQAGAGVQRLYRENAARLLRFGVVRAADAAARPLDVRLWESVKAEQEIPLILDVMAVGAQGMMSPATHLFDAEADAASPVVKLFLDGAGRCAMDLSLGEVAQGTWAAAARAVKGTSARRVLQALRRTEARWGRPGRVRLGFFVNEPEQVEAWVGEAHRRGYPVATHALGNAAVRRILEIYQRVQDRYGAPKRPFRVEHALFLSRDLIAMMARLQVAAVVQPGFLYQYGPLLESLPLPEQLKVLPLRSMLDAGVLVAGSSDGPCGPEDPLLGMDCACRRMTLEGRVLDETQALGVNEALRLYTAGAARVMGCQAEAGSLERGKRADMVILSGDPHSRGFDRVRVSETLLAGATVWKRGMGMLSAVEDGPQAVGTAG